VGEGVPRRGGEVEAAVWTPRHTVRVECSSPVTPTVAVIPASEPGSSPRRGKGCGSRQGDGELIQDDVVATAGALEGTPPPRMAGSRLGGRDDGEERHESRREVPVCGTHHGREDWEDVEDRATIPRQKNVPASAGPLGPRPRTITGPT